MPKVERFEDLHCWQKSRILVKAIFIHSSGGKLKSDYELKAQMRRSALSVMNNIAEGFCRFSKKEFIRFLDIASGSAGELKSMIYVMDDLGYVSKQELTDLHKLVDEARNLTLALLKYLVKSQTIKHPNT